MLEPIIDDIERALAAFKTALLVVVVAALAFWVARCTGRKDGEQAEKIKVLTHTVMVAETTYVHDTVRAYRTKLKYETALIQDTVMRHDTVYVRRDIADSAINACTEALHSCERVRLLNDSLTRQLGKQKSGGIWSRLGCNVGPSIVAARDGTVKAGVGATCGIKVWP